MRSAFRFFHKNAGGIVGQAAICAVALARAEEYAISQDWQVSWEWDDIEPNCEVLILHDCDGNVIGSLGGIDVNFDEDARRVFKAEVALEAMSCQMQATFGIGR